MIRSVLRPGLLLPGMVTILLLSSGVLHAQGSIFGIVVNSDISTPANGEISFFGFLDDTDEEVRIESSVGAGYDAGNWFDDFQNYLTEAAGNPYDFYFHNRANAEGAILSNLIPNNSYQQEDIVLGSLSNPPAPTGLVTKEIGASAITIGWNYEEGLTYHVYRREAQSSGSFFRIDDPSGSLSNPGVDDSVYVDSDVDGVSDYQYLVIAEDGLGNLSPHSAILDATEPSYLCGDADGNGSLNISDGVFLVAFIFGSGPAPDPYLAGDCDCTSVINISDAVYMIAYIFGAGPPPCAACP